MASGIFEWVDSIHFDVITMTAFSTDEEGIARDWVMVWSNYKHYLPDLGQNVYIFLHFAAKIEGGKIIDIAQLWDQLDQFNQMGYELVKPE